MGFSMTMDAFGSFETLQQDTKIEKVFNILSGYLSGTQLDEAMKLWQTQYSHQSIDKLSFFIFELESHIDIRHTRREILKKLQVALDNNQAKSESKEIGLKKNVEQRVTQQVQAQEKVEAVPVVSLQSLNAYFEILLEALAKVGHQDRMEMCVDYLLESEFTTFVKEEMIQIILGEGEPNHILYDVDNIRGSINMIYSVLCECYGPMKADQTLAKAMAEVSSKYPAENFSQFL